MNFYYNILYCLINDTEYYSNLILFVMTRENLEIAKQLVEKIDAAERLCIWCAKGFTYNSGIRGIANGSQIKDNSAEEIRKDLIMLLPEIEQHFQEMKKNYEREIANLK